VTSAVSKTTQTTGKAFSNVATRMKNRLSKGVDSFKAGLANKDLDTMKRQVGAKKEMAGRRAQRTYNAANSKSLVPISASNSNSSTPNFKKTSPLPVKTEAKVEVLPKETASKAKDSTAKTIEHKPGLSNRAKMVGIGIGAGAGLGASAYIAKKTLNKKDKGVS
jgi:hypothetical protein